MPQYLRVKNKEGAEYSIVASKFNPKIHTKVETGAADAAGTPLPDKPAPSPATDDRPYSKRQVKELEAEIERRNTGRADEDLIDPDGTTKPYLVAALEADDAAGSDENEES